MNSHVIALMVAVCLAFGGCTGNSHTAPDQPVQRDEMPKVDPMIFVLLYQAQMQEILGKHLGEKPDCDGALAQMLRFIADHRQDFLNLVKNKPATWQPAGTQTDGPIRLLMSYSEKCPEQVERLNQAIRSLIR